MDEFENGVTAGVADQIDDNPTENVETVESEVESAAQNTETATEPEIPNNVWAIARQRSEREAQQRVDRQFAQRFAGYKNPETGAPVKSMQDYFAALDAQNKLDRQRAIEQATANQTAEQRAALQRLIDNDPEKAQLKAGFCTAMSGSSFLVLAIAASNASRPDARTAITKSFSPAPRTASSASPSSSIICLLEGVAMPA